MAHGWGGISSGYKSFGKNYPITLCCGVSCGSGFYGSVSANITFDEVTLNLTP